MAVNLDDSLEISASTNQFLGFPAPLVLTGMAAHVVGDVAVALGACAGGLEAAEVVAAGQAVDRSRDWFTRRSSVLGGGWCGGRVGHSLGIVERGWRDDGYSASGSSGGAAPARRLAREASARSINSRGMFTPGGIALGGSSR